MSAAGQGSDVELIKEFAERVKAMLDEAVNGQTEAIRRAGATVARTLERGGLIHTLGTGHSHLLAEEIYSRAGGLLPVNVIQSAPLMLHEDAVASGEWERLSGVAHILLEHASIEPSQDTLIVISNSGRNAVPVEAAEWARARGMPVIAVTSLAHSRTEPSLVPSGKKLYEVADVVIDNEGAPGDALMEVAPGVRLGATSTIIGAFLLHAIVLSAVAQSLERGTQPPALTSGNIAGAHETNQRMIHDYPHRLAPAYERLRARIRSGSNTDRNTVTDGSNVT